MTSLGLAGEAGIFASLPFYPMFSGVPNGPLRLSPPQVHAAVHNSGITKDVALTAARLEAHLTDLVQSPSDREQVKENRRRKWDCFHVATALDRNCGILYALDDRMLNKKQHLDVGGMQFLKPKPKQAALKI